MIDERKTAVISYIDKYYLENLELDFLNSLFEKAKYKGKVIILNYGMTPKEKEHILCNYDIEFVDCKKIMPVYSNRYFDIPNVIDNIEKSITHILLVDCGDVWFQESITSLFDECEKKIGSVAEKRPMGSDEFTQYCLNNLDDKEKLRIGRGLEGKNIVNSGLICGPRELVRDMVNRVAIGMRTNSTSYFGVDQVYYDSEWYKLEDKKKILLDEKYNFVLISNKDNFIIENDTVYDRNGSLVIVVHNAGANWRLLKRPFENRNTNEQQYFEIQANKLLYDN